MSPLPSLSAAVILIIPLGFLSAGAPRAAAGGGTQPSGDAPHWADVPLHPPLPPGPQAASWSRGALDDFVLARLEHEGLAASGEADPWTLVRRLYLDLIGLPPDPDAADAFAASSEPDAYERLVDRLLQSPRFGERWARWWLDLARFADTNGYEADYQRHIWPFRDWVIWAFNQSLPFDEFTVEQLAGDLLSQPSEQQLIATGFHRNTLINTEDGTKEDEFKDAAVKDRVNTTFTVWQASTAECAQCHDHKYDPISQQEYYQLYAFFNSTTDQATKIKGVWESDEIRVCFGDRSELERLRAEAARADAELASEAPDVKEVRARWEDALRASASRSELPWRILSAEDLRSEGGAMFEKLEDRSVVPGGADPARDVYHVVLRPGKCTVTGVRLEALPDPFRGGLAARGPTGAFEITRVEVRAKVSSDREEAVVEVASALADSEAGGPAAAAIDTKDDTGWSSGKVASAELVLRLAMPLECEATGAISLRIAVGSAACPQGLSRFRLSVTAEPEPHRAGGLPDEVRAAIEGAPSPQSAAVVAAYFRATAPELAARRAAAHDARERLHDFENGSTAPTMILREGERRPAHRLVRGNFLDRAEEVIAGIPAAFRPTLSCANASRPTRLDLARWLVDPRNARTARVTANRVWGVIFGRGLVETSEDFGVQGEPPRNPELLEWLASELRLRWDLKALLRAIVTSSTYRQSSAASSEALERDRYNRLLGRGPRFRVEAEMVRDVALEAAGLLSSRIGGPSVFPPQPDSVFESVFLHGPLTRWPTSVGEDRYRRGLYTFLKRIAPHPMLRNFDAPNRSVCTVRRSRSNTPLMALTTLNDPAFVEAAGALAARMRKARGSDEDRVRRGFRLCVTREPRPAELVELVRLLEDARRVYGDDAAAARALVKSASPGDAASIDSAVRDLTASRPAAGGPTSSASAPPTDPPAEDLAAWIVVGNVLLNLDATLTKS